MSALLDFVSCKLKIIKQEKLCVELVEVFGVNVAFGLACSRFSVSSPNWNFPGTIFLRLFVSVTAYGCM